MGVPSPPLVVPRSWGEMVWPPAGRPAGPLSVVLTGRWPLPAVTVWAPMSEKSWPRMSAMLVAVVFSTL